MKEIINIFITAILLVSVIFMGGCTKESPTEHSQEKVRIELSIPDNDLPNTRGFTDDQESDVGDEIHFMIFNNNSNGGRLVSYRLLAKDLDYRINPSGNIEVIMPMPSDLYCTFVFIANVPTTKVDNIVGTVGLPATNITKADLIAQLNITGISYWPTDGTLPEARIPMYGEARLNGNMNNVIANGPLPLRRMLARIDVINNVDPDIFKMTKVYLANRNTGGKVIPPVLNGYMNPKGFDVPHLPEIAADLGHTLGIGTAYEVELPDDNQSILRTIYAFESAAAFGNPDDSYRANATCLIIEGVYTLANGTPATTYFRVDFTSINRSYMPLLRNHRYIVNIDDVISNKTVAPGFPTPAAALASYSMVVNDDGMTTSIFTMDDATNMRYIYFDPKSFVAVSRDRIELPQKPLPYDSFKVVSSSSWKAALVPSWITLSETTGNGAMTSVGYVCEENTTGSSREGLIIITTKLVSATIVVTQEP